MGLHELILTEKDFEDRSFKNSNLIDVFIDMDGVLADFQNSKHFHKMDRIQRKPPRMYEVGFFETLDVLPGARWAIRVLLKNPQLRLHILTKPVTNSYNCYSEKVAWIGKNFPELLDKMMIVHDKYYLSQYGRILIDDHAPEWKEPWESTGGTFIHFRSDDSARHWVEICARLNPDYFNMEHVDPKTYDLSEVL